MAREAPVGNVAIVPDGLTPCLGQRTLLIRANKAKVEPSYLTYLLLSDVIQGRMHAKAGGATVPHLNMEDVRQLELPDLPPLQIQRRIAGVLGAYDHLIVNNLRRSQILEQMARALYREWFLEFRFPGHERVRRNASPVGTIPEGWEVKALREICEVNRDQIRPPNTPPNVHYIDISSVSPGQIDAVTTYAFDEAPGRARRIVQHGDILWSCVRPNRRSHALVMEPVANTVASTGFAVLTPTKVPFTYLYFATTTDDFVAFLTNNATGAAYPAVTAKTFENARLVIPNASLLRRFGEATIPMAEQINVLQRQSRVLRRTRDLLLPSLLSGQITLDEAAA